MTKMVGTLFYIAPEVFKEHYTYHCDMWSVGVVMFIMLFGFPPFHGETDRQTQDKIMEGFYPEVRYGYGAHFPAAIPVSQEAKDLLRRLLDTDPALRLSASEALEHAWLHHESSLDTRPLSTVMMTNLAQFQSKCKFKEVVLAALSSAMDQQDLDDLKDAFAEFDVDGDGCLTAAEMKHVLRKSANNNTELEDQVKAILSLDVDGDGTISYDELVLACVSKKLAAKEDRLLNVFQALDLNGDGKVTADEIEEALEGFYEEGTDIQALISEIDADGDGTIDYDEFVSMFMEKEIKSSSRSNSRRGSASTR